MDPMVDQNGEGQVCGGSGAVLIGYFLGNFFQGLKREAWTQVDDV